MAVKGSAQERRLSQIELMGHLFRRTGFGATRDALEAAWVWRMIHTQRPLEEKMVLFWHCLFATGNAKVESPLQMAPRSRPSAA